jgi:hypothetical protein
MDFSSDPDLIDLINSESFIRKVRRTSITLGSAGLISNEDIKEIALGESFPRVALILSTTRSKKGSDINPVFGGLGPRVDYEAQYREIRRVILSSVYSEGIQRIVASLTAALCIKQIPLNSDVQLFDLGKELENQALSDLDRIIGLIEVAGVQSSNATTEPASSDPNLYFSSSIDPSYISEEVFSKIRGRAAVLEDVQLLPNLEVPQGYKAFCWIYITGTSISREVETGFFIEDGALVEEVIESIALHTNEACIEKDSTLLCSPNRGSLKRETLTYKKSELHPTSLDGDANKEITFTLSTRIHYITFSSRTLSTEVNRELVSIRLYLLPEELALDKDMAIANRYSSYASELEGIVYGTKNTYYSLDKRGPHSLLMDVERGASSADISNQVDQIDTLYFRLKPGCSSSDVKGSLRIRIASPPNEGYTEWSIDTTSITTPEGLALDLLSSMYERHLDSKLLGAMPHSNAIQVIPFTKTENEVRMVLDLIEVPRCIEVATGTSLKPLTQYKEDARSISVKTLATLPSDTNNSSITSPHAARATSPIGKSKRLQSVYDKMDFLKSVDKHRYRGVL